MAYEVTATRRRPSSFETLAGQDFVVATLSNSLASGRIAHSYLFSGPRGVGKTSAARILARSLNCVSGPTATPCGTCDSCLSIARGNAMDVIEIDGASNTSVNDVRQIKDEVLFAPANSRYKVYIIDEVHMLSNSAFNALLKTIEEPPPYIVFIFATTEVHKVPATIKSRCQQFNFRLVPLEVIKRLVGEAAAEAGASVEDGALGWIAREAGGSLRDAYTLLDQVLSFSGSTVSLDGIRDKLGLVGFDQVDRLVAALAGTGSAGAAAGLEALDEILVSGIAVEQVVIELNEYFRSLLFIKSGVNRAALLSAPVERFSPAAVDGWTVPQLEKGLSLLLDLFRDLRYSINPRFEVELVVSRLARLSEYLHPAEVARQVAAIRRELLDEAVVEGPSSDRPGAQPSPRPAAQAPREQGDDAASEGGQEPPAPGITPGQRAAIVESLMKTKRALASSLGQSLPWEVHGNELVLTFETRFSALAVRAETSAIAAIVAEVTGRRFILRVEEAGLPATEAAPASDERIDVARRVFRGDLIQ